MSNDYTGIQRLAHKDSTLSRIAGRISGASVMKGNKAEVHDRMQDKINGS